MKPRHLKLVAVVILLAGLLCVAAVGQRGTERVKSTSPTPAGESERKVTEDEVPKAALAALKKLARRAKITEFAEEIEHGSTFYEGSWKTRAGANMDVLVTSAGDLVEIEEEMPANKAPAEVLKAARKAAGQNAQLTCEKKTMILYEVKFTTPQGRHELLLTPDGRRVEEEVEKGKPDDNPGHGESDDDEDDESDDEDENEDEEEFSIDQVPAPVRATILKEAEGGTIEEIDVEDEDGQKVYEADAIINGQEVEIRVAEDGKLLSKQVEDEDDEDQDEDDEDDDEDEDDAEDEEDEDDNGEDD